MTQEQFAEEVGIGYATLKKYFAGKSSPTIEVFQKMCQVIGVDMAYALSGSGELPYEFNLKYRSIYGLLKNLGYDVCCNPKDEDEICIKTIGLEAYTRIEDITEKVEEFIQFEIYRLDRSKLSIKGE